MSVGKAGETGSANDAIDLSLGFFLDSRVDGHVIEEATDRGDCLWSFLSKPTSREDSKLLLTVSDAAKRPSWPSVNMGN